MPSNTNSVPVPKVLLRAEKEAGVQTSGNGGGPWDKAPWDKAWDKAWEKGPWDKGHWANRK